MPFASPAPPAESAAPVASNEPKSERRIEAERLLATTEITHYDLLGVARDVANADIQKAYIRQAKQFHPDRATGEMADLRPQMANLMARISTARAILANTEDRQEYDSTLGVEVAPAVPVVSPAPPAPVAPAVPLASPAPPAGSAAPVASDEPKSERRIEAERLLATTEITHYDLLGVARDAAIADIQKAFIQRAKHFHPDRATGEMADLRPQMADLMARISAARAVLTHAEKRKEYDGTLSFKEKFGNTVGEDGEAITEDAIVQKLIEADESFIKAKILLRRNKLDEAEELAREAIEANPEHGDYAALGHWIEARKRPRTAEVSDLVELLRGAVEKVPNSEDANFYLAQLLYQAGRRREALVCYKQVMDLNEHNIDAVRMVRILNKKLQDSPKRGGAKKSSAGGFFGSLFGDKKK